MDPEKLEAANNDGVKAFHIVLLFIMQAIVNLFFIIVVDGFMIDRKMHDHEYRDRMQDMAIGNIESVIAEKLHVNVNDCRRCHQ
jgi:hypothetical protein